MGLQVEVANSNKRAFRHIHKPAASQVPPHHIPQLMLEMLCSDSSSSLYASVSGKNTAVFEIGFDAAYAELMLTVVAEVWKARDSMRMSHVISGNLAELLRFSKRIAAGAEEVFRGQVDDEEIDRRRSPLPAFLP